MPISIEQIVEAISELDNGIGILNAHFGPPDFLEMNGVPAFRYAQENDLLLSYLKCVRAVSSLNASIVLLYHGYVQEIGTLCRCIDDFNQDVLFLATPLGEDGYSKQQIRLVEEFFQEEFDNIIDPMRSTQARDRVPRAKILAGIARIKGQPINPSDAKELQRTLQQGFSGYVHGAYVHIMEMYGGKNSDDLHFHTRGLVGTIRIQEWTEPLASRVFQTMVAVLIVAKRCSNEMVVAQLDGAMRHFSETTGVGQGDPDHLLDILKSL